MKRLIMLTIVVIFVSGCTFTDVASKVMSGGKVVITLGVETDAVHNNEVVE